jgi:hypothetical protein
MMLNEYKRTEEEAAMAVFRVLLQNSPREKNTFHQDNQCPSQDLKSVSHKYNYKTPFTFFKKSSKFNNKQFQH